MGFSYLVGVRTPELLNFFQGRTCAQPGSKWPSCCRLPRALPHVRSYCSWGCLLPRQPASRDQVRTSPQLLSRLAKALSGLTHSSIPLCPPSFHHDILHPKLSSVSTSREHSLQHISASLPSLLFLPQVSGKCSWRPSFSSYTILKSKLLRV